MPWGLAAAVAHSSHSIPGILLDVMNVVSPHNDGLVHLCGLDNAGQDAPSNRDVASERAFLVNVCACISSTCLSLHIACAGCVVQAYCGACTAAQHGMLRWRKAVQNCCGVWPVLEVFSCWPFHIDWQMNASCLPSAWYTLCMI